MLTANFVKGISLTLIGLGNVREIDSAQHPENGRKHSVLGVVKIMVLHIP